MSRSHFCLKPPELKQAYGRLDNIPQVVSDLRQITTQILSAVSKFRLGSLGISALIPLAADIEGATCFVCKQGVDTVDHYPPEYPGFKENFDSLWDKLKTKARDPKPVDGDQIVNFISNLDRHYKMPLL